MKLRRLARGTCAAAVLATAAVGGAPSGAAAQELDIEHDARLEGYGSEPVTIEGNTAMTWLLFIFIAAAGLSVMFKDAKRSHLD